MILCTSFMKQTSQSQNYTSYGLKLFFFYKHVTPCDKNSKKNVKSWRDLNSSPSLTWRVHYTKWWSLHFLPLALLGYWLISDSCWGFQCTIRHTVDTDGFLMLNWESEIYTIFTGSQTWFFCRDHLHPKWFSCQLENSYRQPSWTRLSGKCAI